MDFVSGVNEVAGQVNLLARKAAGEVQVGVYECDPHWSALCSSAAPHRHGSDATEPRTKLASRNRMAAIQYGGHSVSDKEEFQRQANANVRATIVPHRFDGRFPPTLLLRR